MRNVFWIGICWLTLIACDAPPADANRKPNALFSTTQPSRLYFKNMRSYYYRQSTKPNTKIDLYTLKKIPETADRPLLIPIIVDNWLQDEAYLLLERNNYPAWPADTLTLRQEDINGNILDSFTLANPTWPAQLGLANFLELCFEIGHKISFLNSEGVWIPLFEEKEDRANFLIVKRDYDQLSEQALKKQRKKLVTK